MNEDNPTPLHFDWGSDTDGEKPSSKELSTTLDSHEIERPPSVEPGETEERKERKRKARQWEDQRSSPGMSVTRRKKKPKGMPKRPLSAYNIFFQTERPNVLKSGTTAAGTKIGFEELGKIIGKRWKDLSDEQRKEFSILAEKDNIRYRKEMESFNKEMREKAQASEKSASKQGDYRSAEAKPAATAASSPLPGSSSFSSPGALQDNGLRIIDGPPMVLHAVPGVTTAPWTQAIRTVQTTQHWAGAAQHNVFPAPASAQASHVGAQHVSQAPPSGDLPQPGSQPFPIPPGTEIVLPDTSGHERKYQVQYSFHSMTRSAAQDYIDSLSGRSPTEAHSPHPQQQLPHCQQPFRHQPPVQQNTDLPPSYPGSQWG